MKSTTQFSYGVTPDREHYAVARFSNRTHGVWDACEADDQLYRVIEFDDIPECDWDRITALEGETQALSPTTQTTKQQAIANAGARSYSFFYSCEGRKVATIQATSLAVAKRDFYAFYPEYKDRKGEMYVEVD